MAALEGDRFPEGDFPAAAGWDVGDVEEGFARADVIVEQTILHQSQTHHPMEPRSAMAYWQNGKCYLHCSTQSTARTAAGHASRLSLDQEDMVLIAEYCGGGFGSKGRRLGDRYDPGTSLAEGGPTGDDAGDAGRRDVLRPGGAPASRAGPSSAFGPMEGSSLWTSF